MNIPRYFIDRPVFAAVLSLLIVLAGLLAMGKLPLGEYPQVAPPTVLVRAAYPGANAKILAETVAAPLEQEINGLEGMLYMSSQSTSDGRLTLNVTFQQGTDPQKAQIEVQNRVARALPRLPAEVQKLGVTSQKTSPDMLMVVHLVSPNERYDLLHLSNFAHLQIKDVLARVPGVSDVAVWGAGEYSLRVWIDPEKLTARNLTVNEVLAAIREQNAQVAAGVVGQPPHGSGQFQLSINTQGRLSDPEEFNNITVRTGTLGEVVKLSDVARVELGSNSYSLRSLLNNQPAAAIQIIQSPNASAIEVADAVRAKMAELKQTFPEGIEFKIAYDPTIFVKASIRNVLITLLEAMLLVVIVVVAFLRTWRASVIPLLAVPVSLVGTLAAMYGLGFSLNTLSLFGLVLSIGIVVDDAIVVVENVERHLRLGLSPKEAAYAAMREVTSPIIAITLVLVAIFLPTAFIGGITGQFYKQFAVTIAISTVISAFNSLTLSPALAALILKPSHKAPSASEGFFDRLAAGGSSWYSRALGTAITRKRLVALAYLIAVVGAGALFAKIPTGFVPAQDKYFLVGIAQLPDGASLDRTEAVTRKMTEIALAHPGVDSVVAFPGLSINGFVNNSSSAVVFAILKPFEVRKTEDMSAGAIAGALNQKYASIQEGMTAIFPPPPVPGIGALGGFKLQIEDRTGQGYQALSQAAQAVIAKAATTPELAGVFSSFSVNVPQVFLDVDRQKAKTLGVDLASVYQALQVHLGSYYVNDFTYLGRNYQVNVQADARFRADPDAIGRLYVRNGAGEMLPISAIATAKPAAGPDPIGRYNGYLAADLSGGPALGVSAEAATAAMERVLKEALPPGFAYEWTDLTYQQKREGSAGMLVFPLAILLAFLILAALYNDLKLPFAVMLIVPTVLLSGLLGVWITNGDNNIFTQIGFVVLIGLAAKNAILIVEFARQLEKEGSDPVTAVLEAAKLRLRPILMTSLAFVAGTVPLVLASGAGAEMRQAMGIAVFSGMIGTTVFGLFLTPVFYVLFRNRSINLPKLGALFTRKEAKNG